MRLTLRDITTIPSYDQTKYTPVGIITGQSIHAVSEFRAIYSNVKGLFGGKAEALEKKMADTVDEALDDLIESAENEGMAKVVGVSVTSSSLTAGYGKDVFMVTRVTGTGLIGISEKKSGKRTTSRPRKGSRTGSRSRSRRKGSRPRKGSRTGSRKRSKQ